MPPLPPNADRPSCRSARDKLARFDCLPRPKHVVDGPEFDDNDNPIAAGEINTNMADMISTDMQSFASRVATFQQPHQLSKRRASSQGKKKNQQTTEWPHESPSPEEVCMRYVVSNSNIANTPTACARRFLLQAKPGLQRQRTMLSMRRKARWMGSIRQSTTRALGTFERLRMGAVSLLLATG